MALSDKILALRKSHGYSQEDLAEKLNVSRQSVSKWESASSVPDVNKILDIAKLFGVTTDYLLRDEIAVTQPEVSSESDSYQNLTEKELSDFLFFKQRQGRIIALGVMLCILSPVVLILLGGLHSLGFAIKEAPAIGTGLGVLFIMAAFAVALFIYAGIKGKKYNYIAGGEFSLEPALTETVKVFKEAYSITFTKSTVAGVILCILSVLPLIITAVAQTNEIISVICVDVLLSFAAIAIYLFVKTGTINNSYDMLLKIGEYSKEQIAKNKKEDRIGSFYWPLIVAVYLGWSFISGDWHITWIVWPIAGLLFAVICAAFLKKQ